MIITAIEEQKKNKGRRSIFIDGAFAFGMTVEDVYLMGLKEGMELSEKSLEALKAGVIAQDAKNKALHYLSYSRRTKREMIQKLKAYDFDEETIEGVIDFLKAHKFLDDLAYAQMFAEKRMDAGYGKQRLKSELFYKGIDSYVIDEVLEGLQQDPAEQVMGLLEKKIKSQTIKEFNESERQKIYAFLNRRGFGYDDAKDGIRLYWEERSP